MPTTAAKKAATTKSASEYTAHHLLVLEGLEAVRKRPGMYIGSTDTRGLMHCLWEIIDNAVDEALGRRTATTSRSSCTRDGSVEVRDNGRGIPVDIEPRTGLSGVEVVFTKLHAGGKFGGGSYAASGGLHGVGASVVNALSARLDVEVDRRRQDQRDVASGAASPGVFDGDGPRRGVHRRGPGLTRKGGRVAKGAAPAPGSATGPTGRSSPRTPTFDFDELLGRARQTSFLVPGPRRSSIRDLRGDEPRRGDVPPRRRHHASSASSSPPTQPVTDVLRLQGTGTFTETVPVLDDKGHMTPPRSSASCGVDVALRWGTGYDTEVRSFVNIIATPKGGTHVSRLRAGR